MSSSFNQYILAGVKLPYSDGCSEKIERYADNGYSPSIKHVDGLAAVSDGMNGEYLFIGRIIEKGERDQPFEDIHNFGNMEKLFLTPGAKDMLSSLIRKTFPDLAGEIEAVDIDIYFFTHWH